MLAVRITRAVVLACVVVAAGVGFASWQASSESEDLQREAARPACKEAAGLYLDIVETGPLTHRRVRLAVAHLAETAESSGDIRLQQNIDRVLAVEGGNVAGQKAAFVSVLDRCAEIFS